MNKAKAKIPYKVKQTKIEYPYTLLPKNFVRTYRDLVFDSNFECGNVDQIIKRTDLEYDIHIRGDYEAIR